MVKSIMFDGEEGYIGSRYGIEDKPEKPKKGDGRFSEFDWDRHGRVFKEDKYNEYMERYRVEMEFYKEHVGKYKVECSENLVGRRFEFDGKRINLIFGPNASGKTTILKGIASHALCVDGWSKFAEPLDIKKSIWGEKETLDDYREGLRKHIRKFSGTTSEIDWDGSPIYYHNFGNRGTTGCVGDLQGSILNGIGEELMYCMNRGRVSAGQDMFYQFSKLAGFMSKVVTYEDILDNPKRLHGGRKEDDCWRMCYDVQEEYYRSFPMSYDRKGQNTYLFDEIDRSMDMLNVDALYSEVLPALSEKYGQQIIIISHSPLVLRDRIYKSDRYNFISIDDEYTERCREILFV